MAVQRLIRLSVSGRGSPALTDSCCTARSPRRGTRGAPAPRSPWREAARSARGQRAYAHINVVPCEMRCAGAADPTRAPTTQLCAASSQTSWPPRRCPAHGLYRALRCPRECPCREVGVGAGFARVSYQTRLCDLRAAAGAPRAGSSAGRSSRTAGMPVLGVVGVDELSHPSLQPQKGRP
jgi:hypothetical protein